MTLVGLKVFLRRFELMAEIGLYAHERGRTQPLVIDVVMTVEPKPVHGLADLVDYSAVARMARAVAERGHVDLVETFAQDLAAEVLGDPRVLEVEVTVQKPDAVPEAAGAGVTLTARR